MVSPEAGSRAAATLSRLERFRAPFSLRCGALLIDYILPVSIVAFSTLLARIGDRPRATMSTAETVGIFLAVSVALLNFVGLTALRGQTLGKWATGLCIRRMDGERVNVGHALLRHLVGYPLSLLTLGLGFLFAAFNAQGRALHDLIAGTIVVHEDVSRKRRALPEAKHLG
jgi:uncharacterized RDD family membrane protein YckC